MNTSQLVVLATRVVILLLRSYSSSTSRNRVCIQLFKFHSRHPTQLFLPPKYRERVYYARYCTLVVCLEQKVIECVIHTTTRSQYSNQYTARSYCMNRRNTSVCHQVGNVDCHISKPLFPHSPPQKLRVKTRPLLYQRLVIYDAQCMHTLAIT